MSDNTIFDQVKEKIIQDFSISESEAQVTLGLARERYKRELMVNRDFHEKMAQDFEKSGEDKLALRQKVLTELYQSTIDRA